MLNCIGEMAKVANSMEAYRSIVESIFSDGVYNDGRFLVLSMFTDEVCLRHPEISEAIRKEHTSFLLRLNRQPDSLSCSIL